MIILKTDFEIFNSILKEMINKINIDRHLFISMFSWIAGSAALLVASSFFTEIFKSRSENRDDELNLQYLPLCSTKIDCYHGIVMSIRENENRV